MSIFTFIDGFPPSDLIVFCRSPPGICAVSTKKNEMTRFTMRNRFPLFKGQVSLIGHSDPFLTSVDEQNLTPLMCASHRALRFHFGNPNTTERSIPVVLTAYVGGSFSIHFALHPTPMWESDLHTSTVHRQKQESRASGKLEGIELALKVSCVRFYLFWMLVFSGVSLSSSVELKKRWPNRVLFW